MNDVVRKLVLVSVLLVLGGVLYYVRLDIETVHSVNRVSNVSYEDVDRVDIVLLVHLAGAILYPGVYEVPVGITVMEAISYGGGIVDGANLDKVNLAKEVRDGQRIFVPFMTNKKGGGQSVFTKIAINRVDSNLLQSIPGIGVKIATEIVLYRQQYGFFKSYDDLLAVKYIGEAMLKKIKPYIILD